MIRDLPLSHASVTTGETKALKKLLVRLRVKLSRNVSSRAVGQRECLLSGAYRDRDCHDEPARSRSSASDLTSFVSQSLY